MQSDAPENAVNKVKVHMILSGQAKTSDAICHNLTLFTSYNNGLLFMRTVNVKMTINCYAQSEIKKAPKMPKIINTVI